jgi:hypothetical protein
MGVGGRVVIGPLFPGGGYEGILCVRDDIVQNTALLANAVQNLTPLCTYQLIASIDQNGKIRRYHGFPAKDLQYNGNTINSPISEPIGFTVGDYKLSYNPNGPDSGKFYTGTRVSGNLLTGNILTLSPGQGFAPVFIDVSSLPDLANLSPKLPPGAGL